MFFLILNVVLLVGVIFNILILFGFLFGILFKYFMSVLYRALVIVFLLILVFLFKNNVRGLFLVLIECKIW